MKLAGIDRKSGIPDKTADTIVLAQWNSQQGWLDTDEKGKFKPASNNEKFIGSSFVALEYNYKREFRLI